MSASIDSSGDIAIGIYSSVSGRSTNFLDRFNVGDRLPLVFTPVDGTNPPYSLRVLSLNGATLLDTLVKDLPTGLPQSAPPIDFLVSAKGIYRVEIRELHGTQRGEAQVRIF